ncbi:HAD-IIB family hydrolase [Stieleria mannarensis]|uniref:HAD-IIB family hydrolase n=1 Tax=Stieleria mannarensis TaxID=2755585 RepID=UPI001603488E|nr:HAD-IIB family hydrolase [Rhodopirellula sp. JC639]
MNLKSIRTVTTLATDLDGTLIPVRQTPEQHAAVKHLGSLVVEHSLQLIFVTGRSFELTFDAMTQFDLPHPASILCDVGSTMWHRSDDGSYQQDLDYQQALLDRMGGWTNAGIQTALCERVEWLTPQSPKQQTPLKCSFDFPHDAVVAVREQVAAWITEFDCPLAYTISRDPDTGEGLMDILPVDVNKGSAIQWWASRRSIDPASIVFAGDSGNDTAAMTRGFRAVLVGNADEQLRAETRDAMAGQQMLYLADGHGPEGVRDGLMYHLEREERQS